MLFHEANLFNLVARVIFLLWIIGVAPLLLHN